MRHIIIGLLLGFGSAAMAQGTKDIDVNYMLRGYIYAHSSIADSSAPGGFGESDNLPRRISSSLYFKESGLFLKIDTSRHRIIDSIYNGYTLFIVNKTDTTACFSASDSRLYVTAEAYIDEKWQAIEYLPSSWCGNSYHKVYLKSREYWFFSIPKYTGKIKTKIRYKLADRKGGELYSNEIEASINAGQLTEKQGHDAINIMDPYSD